MDKDINNNSKQEEINLSPYINALIDSLSQIKSKKKPDELSKINVSQTVSFFALAYEKIRNAVEYREDHQIRRAAIERILKRLLMLNPSGKDIADSLIRELLWARYFDLDSLGYQDIEEVQKIINKYLYLYQNLTIGQTNEEKEFYSSYILDLLTCEIEESLSPDISQKKAIYSYFIYQVLRKKIKLETINEDTKDAYLLSAIEKAYRRSDRSYQRYHLFTTFYQPINFYSETQLKQLLPKLPKIFNKIEGILKNQYSDQLARFVKKQLPPFLILFSIIEEKFNEIKNTLQNKESLWNEVELMCRKKYQSLKKRVLNLAIRSFIYIFLTKMIFALILEFPLSQYFYNEVNWMAIGINTLFPPFLMLFIISFFKIPGQENTKKIYQRIIEIIDVEKNYETTIAFIRKKPKEKKPLLIFGFTVFYSLTFIITFLLIYEFLALLNFNLISQGIFLFFVSVVTFFSYRIKQLVNELHLTEKESIFTPLIDFFFMPILSLGKFFSNEISKLNFFIFIFDFLIEAPFKFIFEIIEEWISFIRKRKEEII